MATLLLFWVTMTGVEWMMVSMLATSTSTYFQKVATFSEDFVNAGSFAGWMLDPVATFNTTGGACADLNAENAELVDAISQSPVGFGFGPFVCKSRI